MEEELDRVLDAFPDLTYLLFGKDGREFYHPKLMELLSGLDEIVEELAIGSVVTTEESALLVAYSVLERWRKS